MLRRTQRRDRAVDLIGVGSVAQCVVAKLVGGRREVVEDFWCAIYLGCREYSGAQDMIEVLVGQQHMGYPASGDLLHVGVDRPRFGERGAGVDEQHPRPTLHHTDSDVEKR